MSRVWLVIALVGCIGGSACYAGFGSPETPAPSDDAPARVGQLDLIEGAVSFRPAAGDTWAIPEPDRDVVTGDRLWVDSVGHVEMEIGDNAIRMSQETELDIDSLGDSLVLVRLPQGSLDVRIEAIDSSRTYEVDVPNAAIFLEEPGEYRVDVSADGDTTRVTAWAGHAQVATAGSTFPVDFRQTATIVGDSTTTFEILPAGQLDDFDRWSRERNEMEQREQPPDRMDDAKSGTAREDNARL